MTTTRITKGLCELVRGLIRQTRIATGFFKAYNTLLSRMKGCGGTVVAFSKCGASSVSISDTCSFILILQDEFENDR
jgi:hypothetical protein